MLESIILGFVQGLVEWLPLSSEGVVFVVKSNFFNHGESASEILRLSLFLHFGTFLAALAYFRKEIRSLIKTLFNYKKSAEADKKLFVFLLITTLISGSLGYLISKIFENFSSSFENFGKFITLLVASFLLLTGVLIIKAKKQTNNIKTEIDLNKKDGIILGIVQGLAVLPGLSRSGLTVSSLLYRKYSDMSALRLSFLMSMPIILGGNLILNLDKFNFNSYGLIGILVAFITGLASISLFLKLVKKINFGYFAVIFGLLMILSAII